MCQSTNACVKARCMCESTNATRRTKGWMLRPSASPDAAPHTSSTDPLLLEWAIELNSSLIFKQRLYSICVLIMQKITRIDICFRFLFYIILFSCFSLFTFLFLLLAPVIKDWINLRLAEAVKPSCWSLDVTIILKFSSLKGIIFKMRSTSFFHVSVPNIYGTSSSTYLIPNISEGDIKGFVFQHNSEVYKFISAAVNLFDWFICWDL